MRCERPCKRESLTGRPVRVQVGGDEPCFYLACRSGLPLFASELVTSWKSDVGAHMSVGDFVESKEMWFLRDMNTRNRQRVLAQAAEALAVRIHTRPDPHAHPSVPPWPLAATTAEMLYEDVQLQRVLDPAQNECMPQGNAARKRAAASVVRHFVGCTDAYKARGPLLIDLCLQQGLAVLLPPAVALGSLEARDANAFAQLKTQELVPLPVVNVQDSSSVHTSIAQRNVHDLARLEPRDILYGALHTSTRLPCRIQALCAGDLPLRATRYPNQLPTVLYPAGCPMMVPVDHPPLAYEQTDSDAQLSPKARKPFSSTALQVLFEDLSMSVRAKPAKADSPAVTQSTRVCLHMDKTMLELAVALAAPGHPMPHVLRLVPRCLPGGL